MEFTHSPPQTVQDGTPPPPSTGWLTHLKYFQHYSPTPSLHTFPDFSVNSSWCPPWPRTCYFPSSPLLTRAHSSPFKGPNNINSGSVFVATLLLSGPHGISATQQLMWPAAVCTWSGRTDSCKCCCKSLPSPPKFLGCFLPLPL